MSFWICFSIQPYTLVYKLTPIQEGKETAKKEADHSRLVGSSFNKQENLQTRLVLGGHERVDLVIHLPESSKFT